MSAPGIHFLSTDDVIAFHDDSIANEGGMPGVRDRGLLEAAVAMPRATFDGQYLHDGLPGMAGAYLFHVCMSHAFIDGNKRAAVLAAHGFLFANGWEFMLGADALFELVVGVASGALNKEALTEKLARAIRPLRKPKPRG